MSITGLPTSHTVREKLNVKITSPVLLYHWLMLNILIFKLIRDRCLKLSSFFSGTVLELYLSVSAFLPWAQSRESYFLLFGRKLFPNSVGTPSFDTDIFVVFVTLTHS
jgi:uncharacterized membrane protein